MACDKGRELNARRRLRGSAASAFPTGEGPAPTAPRRRGLPAGRGGCRTLPRRAMRARSGPLRPRQPMGRFLSFAGWRPARWPRWRALPCSRAAQLPAPPTSSAQDVASRWRQTQMFSQATPPQGSGRLRGAITGKAYYSTVTAQWRGWGSRIPAWSRSRETSINSCSKQQAASGRIYPLFFSSSVGPPVLFSSRDKLGVIATNKVWFWWLLNQPSLLQTDPEK